jgi:hypothetical protein
MSSILNKAIAFLSPRNDGGGILRPSSAPSAGNSPFEGVSGRRAFQHPTEGESEAVQREIRGTVKPKPTARLYEKSGLVPISETIWRRVAAECDLNRERAELKPICKEFESLREFQSSHSPNAARAAAEQHSRDMRERLSRGDFAGVSAKDAKGRDDILRDFRRKSEAAYAQMCDLSRKAAPICEQIGKKLAVSAAGMAARMESQERAIADDFDVSFVPSRQLVTIGQASWRTEQVLPVPGTSDSPARLLALITGE